MIEAAEKCPDARRVAPIRACVFYQIDRLKSGFEAVERTVIPGNCALMGATRLASVFSAASSRVGFFSSLMIIPNGPHTVFVISPFCLHSALFVCTVLIIKQIGRVDTICTQLHSSALCLHDACTPFSTVFARDLHAESLLREAGAPFGATDITTSHSCLVAPSQSAHGRVGRVQTSADRGWCDSGSV